jgi:hypothetical protein
VNEDRMRQLVDELQRSQLGLDGTIALNAIDAFQREHIDDNDYFIARELAQVARDNLSKNPPGVSIINTFNNNNFGSQTGSFSAGDTTNTVHNETQLGDVADANRAKKARFCWTDYSGLLTSILCGCVATWWVLPDFYNARLPATVFFCVAAVVALTQSWYAHRVRFWEKYAFFSIALLIVLSVLWPDYFAYVEAPLALPHGEKDSLKAVFGVNTINGAFEIAVKLVFAGVCLILAFYSKTHEPKKLLD